MSTTKGRWGFSKGNSIALFIFAGQVWFCDTCKCSKPLKLAKQYNFRFEENVTFFGDGCANMHHEFVNIL